MTYINRGRDVMRMITMEGEKGLHKAVIKIAEDQTHMHQEMQELRIIITRLIDLVSTIQSVAIEQYEAMQKIEKSFRPDNEANPDQPWAGGTP